MSQGMEAEHLFDVIGVRFDPAAFRDGLLTINFRFSDLGEDHVLGVGRSAIHHRPGEVDGAAVATVTIDRKTLSAALNDVAALDAAEITGDAELVRRLLSSLTAFTTQPLIEP